MLEEVKKRLNQNLRNLHLPTIRQCYEEQGQLAEKNSSTYEHYLDELVELEVEARRQNRVDRYLRESKLPLEKSWEAFDRKRLPRKVDVQLDTLLEGSFVDRHENLLAFGNPGSGKTHLLCAIGQELIHRGHRVLFTTCSLLVQELLMAKRELRLARLLKRLAKFRPLILDDIGYVQQDREEMEVLFTLLAERYERGSIILTSNLPFSKWEKIFKDPMTTAAAIDRLVHHSIILELNVASYRLEQSKKNKARAVPSNWNGTLLRDLDYLTNVNDARYLDMLVRGYAVSGTARHSRRWAGYYDPAREIAHLDTVLDLFVERFRKPDRVIQYGCSGGGHVTLAVAEDFSGRIDGAIAWAAHTPVWLMNSWLDGWFVLKALLAPDQRIVELPSDGSLRPAHAPLVFAWRQVVDAAQKTPEGRARLALAVTIGQWPE